MREHRRDFLKRVLTGVGVAGAAATAIALPRYPDSGQPLARIHEQDLADTVKFPPDTFKPIVLEHPKPPAPYNWWEHPLPPAEWLGDPLDHNKPLSEWIYGYPQWTEAEYLDDMEFFMGLQWPKESLDVREKRLRPSLVVNCVKLIVDRAIIVSLERGESTDLLPWEWRAVIVNVVRRNRHPQLLYNAMKSMELELKIEAEIMAKRYIVKGDGSLFNPVHPIHEMWRNTPIVWTKLGAHGTAA